MVARITAAAMLVITAMVAVAHLVEAEACTPPPGTDVYGSALQGNCSVATSCRDGLCACLGGTAPSSDAWLCHMLGSQDCAATETCYSQYFDCLNASINARGNATDSCATFGNTLYLAELAEAALPSINTSARFRSCAYHLCVLTSAWGTQTNCSSMKSAVCGLRAPPPGSTTLPPVGTTTILMVQVFLNGTNWSAVFNNSHGSRERDPAVEAFTADIGALFGVPSRYVVLVHAAIYGTSLMVIVAVQDGCGKTTAQLIPALASVTASSAWLSNTRSFYATIGSDAVVATAARMMSSAPPSQTFGPFTRFPTSSALRGASAWPAVMMMTIGLLMIAALW